MASTVGISVAPANAEQLRAWDGDEGAYWAAHAEYFDRSALPFHHRLLAAQQHLQRFLFHWRMEAANHWDTSLTQG